MMTLSVNREGAMIGISQVSSVACGITMAACAALLAAPATAASLRVKLACASDYYAYCSQHPSEGGAVRQCMRVNGPRLSKGCIDALVASGEVSKAEVRRRSQSASAR